MPGSDHYRVNMYSGDTNRAFTADASTHAINTINYEHHEIHAGSHFFVADFETINDAATVTFSVTTPNTAKWLHMSFEVVGTSRIEFKISEDATVTGGAALTPFNNNRNSANTSGATIVKNPTINDAGDEIYHQSSGLEGANPVAASANALHGRDREIILKQNSTYLFQITSRDDGNIVSYVGEWYEHTNKE